jgi:L-alanine-DL-glutamate epimerase-like enolase superfamily enzyme
MPKRTDVRPVAVTLYYLPVETRVPLKFGPETLTSVTCARARMRVQDGTGKEAEGWGETPLSVQWVWPSNLGYEERHQALKGLCEVLAEEWAHFSSRGHALEVGSDFIAQRLPEVLAACNADRAEHEPVPWLAALVCCSVFDQALHDAYGKLAGKPVYDTYSAQYLNRDLGAYLTPAEGSSVSFAGRYPADYPSSAAERAPRSS